MCRCYRWKRICNVYVEHSPSFVLLNNHHTKWTTIHSKIYFEKRLHFLFIFNNVKRGSNLKFLEKLTISQKLKWSILTIFFKLMNIFSAACSGTFMIFMSGILLMFHPSSKQHQQSKLLIYGEKTVTQPVGQPTSQPASPPPTPAPNDTNIKSPSHN